MHLIITFLRRYPAKSIITLIAMLFAGIAEGLGMSMLLPLLGMSIKDGGASNVSAHTSSTLEQAVSNFFALLGINPTVSMLLILFVLSIVLKSVLVLTANRQVGYMVAQVATDLRLSLLRAIFASQWQYFVHQPAGAFTNAFATEASRSASAYLFAMRIMARILNALVYITVALMVAWQATLIALSAGIIILYLLKMLVRYAKQAGRNQTDQLKRLLALMTDTLQSIKPLKAMARENTIKSMLEAETLNLNSALQQQVFSKEALRALQEPLTTIFFAFGLYIALMWLDLPLANVLVMVYMLSKILKTLQRAQREQQSMVIAESAYWSMRLRIKEADEQKELCKVDGIKPIFSRKIRLEKISFSYDNHMVLKDISMNLPWGTFIALSGPSGMGKTTVVDLISGLLLPNSGHIFIDDVPLEQVDIRAWRRMIGYVPQETLLLHDSIYMNITLGDPAFSEKDVKIALQKAGAWDFVSKLPEGIHTVTGERGSRLSGGQRQRITIARALVHKPKLLILDEATSALDRSSEMAICDTLKQLKGELTILAISHHDALVEEADIAFMLENGSMRQICKSGNCTI